MCAADCRRVVCGMLLLCVVVCVLWLVVVCKGVLRYCVLWWCMFVHDALKMGCTQHCSVVRKRWTLAIDVQIAIRVVLLAFCL